MDYVKSIEIEWNRWNSMAYISKKRKKERTKNYFKKDYFEYMILPIVREEEERTKREIKE